MRRQSSKPEHNMDLTEISLTDKQRFWLDHLRACERSGQSMSQYAKAHELNVTAFYNWKATLRRKGVLGEAPAASRLFRKAHVVDGRALGRCRVVLPTGLTLEFDNSTEPSWVAELVRALAG